MVTEFLGWRGECMCGRRCLGSVCTGGGFTCVGCIRGCPLVGYLGKFVCG